MANVHVVTESLACLPHEADVNYAIRVVEHRLNGPDGPFTLDALLGWLSTVLPGDIQPARPDSAAFAEVFEELLHWGVEIVSIHPPTGMGGCAEAARQAARSAGPDAPISVVETGCVGPSLGLVAFTAAVAGDSVDRDSVAALASTVAARVRQVFVSTQPGYLAQRGYDMPAGASDDEAHVFELVDGQLRLVGTVRPAADALRIAYERISAGVREFGTLHVAFASAGADAEVAALATFLGTRLQPAESWIGACDPALALELGRGSYSVAAWEGEEEE